MMESLRGLIEKGYEVGRLNRTLQPGKRSISPSPDRLTSTAPDRRTQMPVTPDAILSISRAFMGSRALLTAVELDVFTLLAKEPFDHTGDRRGIKGDKKRHLHFAQRFGAHGIAGQRKTESTFARAKWRRFLSKDSPKSLLPMILHSIGGWKRWSELTDIVSSRPKERAPHQLSTDPALNRRPLSAPCMSSPPGSPRLLLRQ